MPQSSTAIADLPDNQDVSAEILDQLNDNDNESYIEEIQNVKPVKIEPKTYPSYDYIQDAVIVFVSVFILSQPAVFGLIAKIPYLQTLEAHSVLYNIVIALIIAVLFVVIKIGQKAM